MMICGTQKTLSQHLAPPRFAPFGPRLTPLGAFFESIDRKTATPKKVTFCPQSSCLHFPCLHLDSGNDALSPLPNSTDFKLGQGKSSLFNDIQGKKISSQLSCIPH